MLKNQDIICISSIDWDFIWQGHQEIMSTLAQNGNRVIFIENTGVRMPGIRDFSRIQKRIKNYFKGFKGLRNERENLYIFSPLALPFPYSRLARMLNKWIVLSFLKRWMKIMDFADPVIVTFLPTGTALDIINSLNNKLVVYYCIDNFAASSVSVKKIKRTEKELLKKADLVFVTAQALYEYCSQFSAKVAIFPFGVNIRHFEKIRMSNTDIPEDLKNIKKPIIGYMGGIHKWIDFSLLKDAALNRPDYSFVFVGPVQTDTALLSGLKNVFFLGNKAHQELPLYVKHFSAAIIPYRIAEYTNNVYPTKLNEYLAMGTPVVSTALPEIIRFNKQNENAVRVALNPADFTTLLDESLNDTSAEAQGKRIKIAALNAWGPRIEQMCALIEKSIHTKMIDNENRWKEDIFRFYRTSRRRLAIFTLCLLTGYLLVFYTPFAWFLARPLRIQDSPRQADAIVVFAGGVGESGKWGQGYEERVQYAVELYKKGYARNLIFSSGYTYVFKEPLVMKALAVSLGVPGEAIILEDRATYTYENVKNTAEILKQNNWKTALIVSSPYHMRRVSMVCKKIARNLTAIYTPIPRSLFYDHPVKEAGAGFLFKRINLKQLNGIIHEYGGILYYWFKGWV